MCRLVAAAVVVAVVAALPVHKNQLAAPKSKKLGHQQQQHQHGQQQQLPRVHKQLMLPVGR